MKWNRKLRVLTTLAAATVAGCQWMMPSHIVGPPEQYEPPLEGVNEVADPVDWETN